MNLRRLYQPRNPLFWLLLALNGLNSFLVVVLNTQPLLLAGMLVIAAFAMVNALLSTYLVWQLIKNP